MILGGMIYMNFKKGIATWLILILVIGGVALFMKNGGSELNASKETESGTGIGQCPFGETTVKLSGFDYNNKGTSITEVHSIFVNGDYYGTLANLGTFTASPGDEVTVLFGNNTEASAGFYATKVTEKIGCVGTKTITGFQKDKVSSVTISLFNSDDGLINSGSDANEVTASGEETIEMKLKGTSEDFYGEQNVIVVFDASSSVFQDVKVSGAKKVSVPSQHTTVASTKAFAYELASIDGSAWETYSVVLEATSSEPTLANNISVSLYDNAYFIDAETNEIVMGYEDEDYNDVGFTTATGTIYIS
jgi:hypothetical protein